MASDRGLLNPNLWQCEECGRKVNRTVNDRCPKCKTRLPTREEIFDLEGDKT